MRGRGTLPALAGVTISGPYNVKGPGETQARRRVFACKTRGQARKSLLAPKRSFQLLTRRAYRRPSTDADVQRLLPFYTAGKAEGGFDRGIQKALLETRAGQPAVHVSHRERTARTFPPTPLIGSSDIEIASRLSFSFGAAFPMTSCSMRHSGTVEEPAILDQQVRRMLADRRSRAMSRNSHRNGFYLGLSKQAADEILFPNGMKPCAKPSAVKPELFLDSILGESQRSGAADGRLHIRERTPGETLSAYPM